MFDPYYVNGTRSGIHQIRTTLKQHETEFNMKTIAIIGATNGLGAAAASQLASQGHRLLLIARDKARGEAMIASLRNNSPAALQQQHTLYLADLSSLSSVKRVAHETRHDESSIDSQKQASCSQKHPCLLTNFRQSTYRIEIFSTTSAVSSRPCMLPAAPISKTLVP